MGASFAVTAHSAAEPSSVSESAPDKAGKKSKGKAGTNTMPSKGPSSVSESAPDKTGKDKPAPKMKDSKDMPNPKTPSSANETKPSYPQK
jgi:hypothetical protein